MTWADGYDRAGQTQYMVECLQWATDYFIEAHTGTNEFFGQVIKTITSNS